MSANQPVSPFTAFQTSAIEMHEALEAWVAAGFTRPEALQLLIGLLQGAVKNGQSNG